MQKKLIGLLVIGSLLIGAVLISMGTKKTEENGERAAVHSGIFHSDQVLSHDWGDINIAGGVVTKDFTLTNSESVPLLLTGAVTSCMCTTADITLSDGEESGSFGMHGGPSWTHLVQPGESFDVKVTFDPLFHGPEATGPITRSVNIISKPNPKEKAVIYTRIDAIGNVLSESDYLQKYE